MTFALMACILTCATILGLKFLSTWVRSNEKSAIRQTINNDIVNCVDGRNNHNELFRAIKPTSTHFSKLCKKSCKTIILIVYNLWRKFNEREYNMGKTLKIRKSKPNEDIALYETLHSVNKKLAQKSVVIMCFMMGKGLEEIDAFMPVDSTTIRRWVKAFNERGDDFLKIASKPGRPRKADEMFEGAAMHALGKSPRLFGYDADKWSAKLLRENIRKFVDRDVSIRTVYSVMRRIK